MSENEKPCFTGQREQGERVSELTSTQYHVVCGQASAFAWIFVQAVQP